MHFDGDPFKCPHEKEDKKTYGFQISHFYGSFSNNLMAVKGLNVEKESMTCKLINDAMSLA